MNLLDSINCKKGITLNSQLVDLLSIIDEDISIEEQDRKIIEYINNLKEIVNQVEQATIGDKKDLYILDTIINNCKSIPENKKERVKELYLESLKDFKICDTKMMEQTLESEEINPDIHKEILHDLKNTDFRAKEGILNFTPEKVRKLYNHIFPEGKNNYDRVTFDEPGKYSLYVSIDGQTFCPERLDKMVNFCEKHQMKSKINTFMMYCDFPKFYETFLSAKVRDGEISEKDKKDLIKQSLINYVKDIGKRYGDRIETVDIFNELIYDPVMREIQNFGSQSDVFKEEDTYHPRMEGWQKYLDIEDLCEMALEARK